MEYRFTVVIDTDDAGPHELVRAIEQSLRALDMENGDRLYPFYVGAEYTQENHDGR